MPVIGPLRTANEPALRYGRQYFRPVSGDGIRNDRELVVVANADTGSGHTRST